MSPQIRIALEPIESFVVSQYIRYLVPDEHQPHISRNFLMEFGLVFLHHTNSSGLLFTEAEGEEIPVTEDDILSLRELIPAGVTVGTTPVGLSIHHKLFQALLRYHPEHASELQFGEEEEPSREAFAVQLQQLKKSRKGGGKMPNPARVTPKTTPQAEPKPQRRYHPAWHCPNQKERTTRTIRRILAP